MNISDERLTLPPPSCCAKCVKLDAWTAQDVARYRCGWGHVMAEACPHFIALPLGKEAKPE